LIEADVADVYGKLTYHWLLCLTILPTAFVRIEPAA
jgi:hypothetical protein